MNIFKVPELVVEEYPSKVAASFDCKTEAARAVQQVASAEGAELGQIRLVGPGDPAADRKLQPESGAIARTWIRTHLVFGAVGMLSASVLTFTAIQWGPTALSASPVFTGITLVWVITLSSLMLAGAVTLRMDHDRVLNHVLRASAEGRHTVVAHARSAKQKRRFAKALRTQAGAAVSTL